MKKQLGIELAHGILQIFMMEDLGHWCSKLLNGRRPIGNRPEPKQRSQSMVLVEQRLSSGFSYSEGKEPSEKWPYMRLCLDVLLAFFRPPSRSDDLSGDNKCSRLDGCFILKFVW